MDNLTTELIKNFGNKIRVRVCGILIQDGKILLVKHHSLSKAGYLWAPPGGGVNFGETVEDSLKREFAEETGLTVETEGFLFINEYLEPPLHAIELFFKVKVTGGQLITGTDPEMGDNQIIKEVKFMDDTQLKAEPSEALHSILTITPSLQELINLRGYYKYIPK